MFNGQLSLVKKLNIYTYVSVYTIVRHRYGEPYMLCFLGLPVAMSLDRYINRIRLGSILIWVRFDFVIMKKQPYTNYMIKSVSSKSSTMNCRHCYCVAASAQAILLRSCACYSNRTPVVNTEAALYPNLSCWWHHNADLSFRYLNSYKLISYHCPGINIYAEF